MSAAWAAFAAVREATDQLTDQDLRAYLFDSTVLLALCYAAETWADTAATSRKLLTTHRALERCLLKFNRRTQHLAGLCDSDLRGMPHLRDPAEYVSKAKHRWGDSYGPGTESGIPSTELSSDKYDKVFDFTTEPTDNSQLKKTTPQNYMYGMEEPVYMSGTPTASQASQRSSEFYR
ncbi:hypothetical protein RB195_006684 [Necator americanus]